MVSRRQSTAAQQNLSCGDELQLGLRVHASGERLRTLLKERARLLRDIQKKKLQLDQAAEKTRQSAQAMLEKIAPLLARHDALCQELRELFDNLLAPGRLSVKAHKKVARVRRELEEDGLLSKPDDGLHEGASKPFEHDDDPFGPDPKHPHHQHAPPEVASAAPRGQSAGHESLRTLFKRLALMVHPDRAAHEADRDRYTEAMKQVTQAYEDGDLARLLELEKQWQHGATLHVSDDEAQWRDLERIVRELRAQATRLGRELRETKDLMMMVGPIDFLIAAIELDLNNLETMCDFVKSFRDGKITLTEFVRGPEMKIDNEIDLNAFIREVLTEQAAMYSPAKRQKPRKRSIRVTT